MPPKLQNRIFHIRRNNPHRLGNQQDRARDGVPPPIVSVAVGTAGYKRSWKWAMRMGEAGVLDRVQSLLMYDCNQGSIDAIDSETQSMRRNVRSGSLPIILPGYLPKVDGFLRDPNAFKEFYGLIHRDMEKMVDTVARRSEEVGSPPQIILEWLGFGGHAKLGGILHGMLRERFPDALFLPIILMPREHVLEENMRRETWGAYEETMGIKDPRYLNTNQAASNGNNVKMFPALVTDNRLSRDYQRLDNNLAIGLASMEAGMRDRIDSGSLSETVASFGDYSNGWFGMRVMNRRLDVADVPQRSRWFGPLRGRELVVVNDDAKQLTWTIKKSMWEILDPHLKGMNLAEHGPFEEDVPMRMVITLPVETTGLGEIESDVRDQLDRENFERAYPNLTWSFASANFQENPDDRHMHISLFYPLQTENIGSITNIMLNSDTTAQTSGDLKPIGFGTGHYIGVSPEELRSQNSYGFLSRGEDIWNRRQRRRHQQEHRTAVETPPGQNGNGAGHENGYGHENGSSYENGAGGGFRP